MAGWGGGNILSAEVEVERGGSGGTCEERWGMRKAAGRGWAGRVAGWQPGRDESRWGCGGRPMRQNRGVGGARGPGGFPMGGVSVQALRDGVAGVLTEVVDHDELSGVLGRAARGRCGLVVNDEEQNCRAALSKRLRGRVCLHLDNL